MAGAIAELARMTLVKDFRTIDPASARVILVEGGPRVLLAFPEDLSAKARRSLEKLGVEVLTNTPVELCDAGGVVSGGKRIEARTILWAAGVQAAPAARWLQADKDRAGRVKVNPDLSVPGAPDIFVIGDNATVMQANGQPVPGVAPAAKQMGEYVARVIAGRIAGQPVRAPFCYRNYGNFATIGRHAAVADFGWLKLSGYPAWLLWGAAHIYFLIGFRNRLAVMLDWLWAYVTFQRGVRLITGAGSDS
jgi:NADH dehydrogenase FAD-containing subunit